MLVNALVVVVAAVVLFEVIEHVAVPLAAALRGRRHRPSGSAALVGRVVEVTRWDGGEGQVRLGAEYWSAESVQRFAPGDRAVVAAVRGVTLVLRPERVAVASPGR